MDRSLERALEMKRLRMELKQCPPGSEESERRWERIDELLDKHLEAKGAHPGDCGCWECERHVYDVMSARALGEMTDPQDVATEGQW
jgi:hypothetical protein